MTKTKQLLNSHKLKLFITKFLITKLFVLNQIILVLTKVTNFNPNIRNIDYLILLAKIKLFSSEKITINVQFYPNFINSIKNEIVLSKLFIYHF